MTALVALPYTPPQAESQPGDIVFRVTADLVQVDAVVTDSKGHHVADLKPEEFQILEDGRPQTIAHFAYVHAAKPVAPTPAQPAVSLPASARPLVRNQVQRTIVLLADDLGLPPDGIVAVLRGGVEGALKAAMDLD